MRYFFDIFDGDHWTRDDHGVDCRNDRDARLQAVLALTEMARDQLPSNGNTAAFLVRVREPAAEKFTVQLDFNTTVA